jgi:hypothetical protein
VGKEEKKSGKQKNKKRRVREERRERDKGNEKEVNRGESRTEEQEGEEKVKYGEKERKNFLSHHIIKNTHIALNNIMR